MLALTKAALKKAEQRIMKGGKVFLCMASAKLWCDEQKQSAGTS